MTAPLRPSSDGDNYTRVRRGRVDSVDILEVKEGEMDVLENGSSADIDLNFAIFLLSTAFSAFLALVTATFKNDTTHTIAIIVVVVGVAFGLYLLLSWRQKRRSIKTLCRRIRDRIHPDGPEIATPPVGEGGQAEEESGAEPDIK